MLGGVEVTSVLVVLVLASSSGNIFFPISHKTLILFKHRSAAFLFVVDVFSEELASYITYFLLIAISIIPTEMFKMHSYAFAECRLNHGGLS